MSAGRSRSRGVGGRGVPPNGTGWDGQIATEWNVGLRNLRDGSGMAMTVVRESSRRWAGWAE